jgi:hypothetical protein
MKEPAMKAPSRSKTLALAMLLSVGIISGCANLVPVRTFADETKKLSAAFGPMLVGATASCMEKFTRKQLLTPWHFDAADVDRRAKELCSPINADNTVIAGLNALLGQYADTLLALADDKLPSYRTELYGLKYSLGQVKRPGSSDALVNAGNLAAITSLAEFLGQIATQQLQERAIRDLLGHEAAINAITAALGDYTALDYKAWLKDEACEIVILRRSLNESAKSEPLAANYLKMILFADERQNEARTVAADAFVKSVAGLQKSNSELRLKFDQMDDKQLLEQLVSFAKDVSTLRKQVNDAF